MPKETRGATRPESIIINGDAVDVSGVPLHHSVLDLLRDTGRTGTKCGCDEGDCGACTILLLEAGGRPPRAINGCLALVASLAGREILTAEGLGKDGLHPAQKAMIDSCGSQCGYCTPGIVCSMAEASARGLTADGDRAAIADQLCGNLCRCTGYRPIREAALATPTVVLPEARGSGRAEGTAHFFLPETKEEAARLKQENPEAEYLAGATETAVLINKRGERPTSFVALENIDELRHIERTDDAWLIGAAAPLTDVGEALGNEIPAFRHMLRLFASRQIRHRATIGGNLVTASPIGDSAPLLLALDAELLLFGPDGERRIPLSGFFTGYRKTVLRKDELLTAVRIPRDTPGTLTFQKVSKRREMDISSVSAAIRLSVGTDGTILEARLAYGGVAATPGRALRTEEALIGRTLEQAATPELLELLVSEFTPMDDLRASAGYRKSLIKELFLKHLAGGVSHDLPEFAEADFRGPARGAAPHESARGHVTGSARYVDDDTRGCSSALRLRPVLSPHARARILRIDPAPALAVPGVVAIIGAGDVSGTNNTGPVRHDEPLFAEDEVRFRGQLVCAIVGETEEACRIASGLLEIDYEPLAPIVGIANAIGADSFHTDPHLLTRGEFDSGFEASPGSLEGTLDIGGQEHFYLETHAASAKPDGEGGVFVRSSTQHPSEVQGILAEVLGMPRNRVVVESPRMGGGFGGKETQSNAWAAACALAALKTGREVAVQLDRDHDMEWSGKRHPFLARYRVGYSEDGTLNAADIELISDGGWSLDLSQPVCDRALFHLDNCYHIPHVRFSGRVARTNTVSNTAFRGFGGPQGMLVIEEIMGRIAQLTGLPPELVRERNFYRDDGDRSVTHYGQRVEGNRLPRLWPELLSSSDYDKRRSRIRDWNSEHRQAKRGIAITPVKFGISFTLKHYNQAGALVLVYADGSVQVNHGGTEMGQGLHSKILNVATRELGLHPESVRLMHTRTDKVPNTSATAASSGSDLNGMAVADACRQIRERLLPLAARMLESGPESVEFADGGVRAGARSIPFSELAAAAYVDRIQLSAAGFYKTPDLEWDWEVGKGKPFHYFAFGAAVSEVEIDGFTGAHHIRRVDILHDVGDSLNPSVDRGQIEGGFVQGAGWLTCEELRWSEDGRLLTHGASTYAIPTISDAPLDFRVALLEDATQERTIHGSKAVGEPPLMLAISVREALRDAIAAFGVEAPSEDFASPLTAERVKGLVGDMRIRD